MPHHQTHMLPRMLTVDPLVDLPCSCSAGRLRSCAHYPTSDVASFSSAWQAD